MDRFFFLFVDVVVVVVRFFGSDAMLVLGGSTLDRPMMTIPPIRPAVRAKRAKSVHERVMVGILGSMTGRVLGSLRIKY